MFDQVNQSINQFQEVETKEDSTEKPTPKEIWAMPEKFLKAKKKIKIPLFFYFVFIFLVLASLATVIVLFQQGLIFKPKQIREPEKEATIPTHKEEAEEAEKVISPLVSPAQILEEEVKDEAGILIGSARLTLPEGSLDPAEAKVSLKGSLPGFLEKHHPLYQIIGAVFRVESEESFVFLRPVDLVLRYKEEDLESHGIKEEELKIAILREEWQIEESELDIEDKALKIVLKEVPIFSYALVIEREKKVKDKEVEQKIELDVEIKTILPSSLDSDNDGLTDAEEELYKTNKDLNDTDRDTYPDGLEIVNLYSPLSGPGDRLALSGLVNSYTNPIYHYTLFYPSIWIARAVDEANKEVVFTSQTGEFIEIIAEENPRELSVLDWYLETFSDSKPELVRTTNINGREAVWSQDGQTLYLGQGDKIYILTYNAGLRKDLNFKATFIMMIRNWRLIEKPTLPETLPETAEPLSPIAEVLPGAE